jgi:hypothetical protein
MPAIDAVIDAVPTATAVTVPLASTVATEGADEVHITGRPGSCPLAASRTTAVNVVVPAGESCTVAGDTLIVATGTSIGGDVPGEVSPPPPPQPASSSNASGIRRKQDIVWYGMRSGMCGS